MPYDPATKQQLSTRDMRFRQGARSDLEAIRDPIAQFLELTDPEGLQEMIKHLQRGDLQPSVREGLQGELDSRKGALRALDEMVAAERTVGDHTGPVPPQSNDLNRPFRGPAGIPSRWRKPPTEGGSGAYLESYPKSWAEFGGNVRSMFPAETETEDEQIKKLVSLALSVGPGILAGTRGGAFLGGDIPERLQAGIAAHKSGMPPQAMWRGYGVNVGTLNQPRFEISDLDAALRIVPKVGANEVSGTMGSFLSHPTLYRAYPELENIPTHMSILGQGQGRVGQFNRNSITAGGSNPEDLLSAILHELQHGVQMLERFPGGTNLSAAFKARGHQSLNQPAVDLLNRLGYTSPELRAYARNAGEVEARNVEARFADPNLMNFAPNMTEDVPRRYQWIR